MLTFNNGKILKIGYKNLFSMRGTYHLNNIRSYKCDDLLNRFEVRSGNPNCVIKI